MFKQPKSIVSAASSKLQDSLLLHFIQPLARTLAIASQPRLRVRARRIPQALGHRHQLQAIRPRPVNQPRRQLAHGARVRLVHQRDVPVARRAGALEELLARRRRVAVPVARVDVVGDDLVPERRQRREHVAARREVRRAHVGRLDAEDVDGGLLELLHLLGELVGAQGAEVLRMGPGRC